MKKVLFIALLFAVSTGAVVAATFQVAPDDVAIWRVFVADRQQAQAVADSGFDVLEARGPDYLLVMGDASVAEVFRAQGYQVSLDSLVEPLNALQPDTFFGGYHTVDEHYAHLADVAQTYPHLVRVVDYGDSWYKTQNAATGNDLLAICITADQANNCALNPDNAKPRFVMMAAIHARELTTSEMTWRWIDELVQGYGVDADITALLDHNEMWVIPTVNPDGREHNESGHPPSLSQRKNMHDYTNGTCSNSGSSQRGVDLNRNANFQWGGASTSTNPCSLVYRGPAPASEPEQQALQSLFTNLFVDQRLDDLQAAAPITTTGTFITLHTYSNLVLLPWGWYQCSQVPCETEGRSPNDAGLRSLGFRMSYFNGYETGMPSELLYAASGGTDDYTYGRLGVASFTFEIGPTNGICSGFFPNYSCQDSIFWPENREAFMYAAKTARQPYSLSRGPSITTPQLVETDSSWELSVMADDTVYGTIGSAVPAAQAIQAAEYYLDTPPWAGGTPTAIAAADGTFDTASEALTLTLNVQDVPVGRHMVWVRAQDVAGFWGPFTVQWLDRVSNAELLYLPYMAR